MLVSKLLAGLWVFKKPTMNDNRHQSLLMPSLDVCRVDGAHTIVLTVENAVAVSSQLFEHPDTTETDCFGGFTLAIVGGATMRLFKRKPTQPLDDVLAHIAAAVEILYSYKRDSGYHPTEQDLLMFSAAQKALWEASCTAGYIERSLHQRHRGEPEGSKRFTDDEVQRYHYPS